MLRTVLLLVLCELAYGQQDVVLSQGVCPNVPVQDEFELNKFEGYWDVYEAFGAPYIAGMTCVSLFFEQASEDGRYVNVRLEGERAVKVLSIPIWTANEVYYGEGIVLNSTIAGRWTVAFGGKPDYDSDNVNFSIVATDYYTYAVIYSCTKPSFLPVIAESCFILLRRGDRPPDELDNHKFMLGSYGVNVTNLQRVDNYNCH